MDFLDRADIENDDLSYPNTQKLFNYVKENFTLQADGISVTNGYWASKADPAERFMNSLNSILGDSSLMTPLGGVQPSDLNFVRCIRKTNNMCYKSQ